MRLIDLSRFRSRLWLVVVWLSSAQAAFAVSFSVEPAQKTFVVGEPLVVKVTYGNKAETAKTTVCVTSQPARPSVIPLSDDESGDIPPQLDFTSVCLFDRVEGPEGDGKMLLSGVGGKASWRIGEVQKRAYMTSGVVVAPAGIARAFKEPGKYTFHWKVASASLASAADAAKPLPADAVESVEGSFTIEVLKPNTQALAVRASIEDVTVEAESRNEMMMTVERTDEAREDIVEVKVQNLGLKACRVEGVMGLGLGRFKVVEFEPLPGRAAITESPVESVQDLPQIAGKTVREDRVLEPGKQIVFAQLKLKEFLRFRVAGTYTVAFRTTDVKVNTVDDWHDVERPLYAVFKVKVTPPRDNMKPASAATSGPTTTKAGDGATSRPAATERATSRQGADN